MTSVAFLKKQKISKKKFFKKNLIFLKNFLECCNYVTKLQPQFKNKIKTYLTLNKFSPVGGGVGGWGSQQYQKNIFSLSMSQKTTNTKATLSWDLKNTLNTITIGSLMKHFKVQQGKFIRRSSKGTKILLVSLQNIIIRKYKQKLEKNIFILSISGFDHNLMSLKKTILKVFLFPTSVKSSFILLSNLKISFTKTKSKKIKSIKKRLKKKILLNFLKKSNIINISKYNYLYNVHF